MAAARDDDRQGLERCLARQEGLVRLSVAALGGASRDDLVGEAVGLVAGTLGAEHAAVVDLAGAPAIGATMTAGLGTLVPGPGQPFGVLEVATTRPEGFGAEDAAFLEGVAEVLGAALASRRGDERFHAYLESAPDAVAVVDQDGRIVLVNPTLERLFGYAPGELVGSTVETLVPEGRREGHVDDRTRFLAAATTRPMGSGRELEAVRKDGTCFPVDVSLTPLPGHDGVLVAAAVRDMTARAELEAERRRLHEARLLRRQSLEINDNVIQGLTTAAYALELGETAMARAAINHTLRSARRMISGLLGAAREPGFRPGELRRGRPARVLPSSATLPPLPAPTPAGEGALRVVIADDVVEIRHLLRQVLSPRRGFSVVGEAADGQGAIELTESLKPDALLLDLAMPAMDGLVAIPRIREVSPDTKICVLTGYPTADGGERAAELGAHAYLEKGQATSHIVDVLHQLCTEASV